MMVLMTETGLMMVHTNRDMMTVMVTITMAVLMMRMRPDRNNVSIEQCFQLIF